MAAREMTIVAGLHLASGVFLDIFTPENPVPPQRVQSFPNIATQAWIAPWSARIVDPHGIVYLDFAVEGFRIVQRNLAKRHTQLREKRPTDVNFRRIRKPAFERIFGRARNFLPEIG